MMNLSNQFNPRLSRIEVSKIRQFDQQISSIPDVIEAYLGRTGFSDSRTCQTSRNNSD